jgi:hypothetical protein
MDEFYSACAARNECALQEDSASEVKARLDGIFANLLKNPLPVFTNESNHGYGLVDYSMARRVVFQWLYKPYQKAPVNASTLASALAALEKGDGVPMWNIRAPDPMLKCDCAREPSTPSAINRETTLAIACGDGKPVGDDVDTLRAFYEDMAKDSSFAEIWQLRLECASVSLRFFFYVEMLKFLHSGWKVKSKEQFHGEHQRVPIGIDRP